MFAISAGTETLLIYVAAAVIGAAILGIGKAVMGLVRTRQLKARNTEFDQRTLTEFFFDIDRDPRTGTPARQGWTTKVDKTLDILTKGQNQTTRMLNEVLREIKPDGNGGHNLRGIMERQAEAVGIEVDKQVEERKRVQERDERMEHS